MATTRAQSVAQVQQASGGPVPPVAAGKNYVINGGMDIWQRGTSFVVSNSFIYMADRWNNRTAASSITVSRQSSGAPLGSQYYMRLTSTAGGSYCDTDQIIETANVASLWGKTVTFSIKMRGNATMAGNSGNSQTIFIDKSSTVDASYASTWTRIASVTYANSTLPTGTTSSDWVTYSATITIPNDGTANTIRIGQEYSGTGAANGSILDIAQAQLEVGSTATPFARAGGTIQGELALCYRYFQKFGGTQTNESFPYTGFSYSTTQGEGPLTHKGTMRTTPSLSFSTLKISDVATYNLAVTNLTLTTSGSGLDSSYLVFTVASGTSSGKINYMRTDASTAGYIYLSAEL